MNFGLAHVTIWSGQISHVTLCSFRREKNFASKWRLSEELSTVGNQLERILPKSLNCYHPFQLISHGGNFFRKHSFWSKVLPSAKRTLCHVTNLAAPNGHMSKPKIQMQSIVFFRVLTVQWFGYFSFTLFRHHSIITESHEIASHMHISVLTLRFISKQIFSNYIRILSSLPLLWNFFRGLSTNRDTGCPLPEKKNEIRRKIRGAFHYAKDSGNFGRNSNGKVRFGFFRPEYSGSPLELVHLFRLEYSDWNSPFHFWQTGSLP